MKKILITGGHAGTPALATIDYIQNNKDWEIVWVGTKRATEAHEIETLEHKIFSKLDIKYFTINSGRLQKKFSKYTLPSLLRIPKGLWDSYFLIRKINPEIVLSFGGFISVPVVIAAWLQGIPIVVHEQTMAIGLANKICSFFAEKIAISRIETKKYVNSEKCIHTGNPILENVLSLSRKKSKRKTIYITGGSRGAQIINKAVFESLEELTKKYEIIHQTGDLDISFAKKIKLHNYNPVNFVDPKKLHEIYETADLVVSRAGANTVSEIIYHKIKSVLIPIPWSRYNEQNKNAKLAKKAGVAEIIAQENLSSEVLINKIDKLSKKRIDFKKLKTFSKDKNGAGNLVDLVDSLIE